MPKNGKPVTIRMSYKTANVVRDTLANKYDYRAQDAHELLVAIQALDHAIAKDPSRIKFAG
jgi:hypothetical protein